ncbi:MULTISPECIES: TIGR01457 family HAD-type hydrolase [Lysinibacillus]|uniref:TIGR01457 family HAD-type hydrolase n=1 Tax=Lysinibacillus capsici TaxID=2115968 RepID=A0ABY8KS87_9BACI|nr:MULTISPECIES: TIGR01457 family HAD-type hydrolase [Lysinibacillus]MCR6524531.1 TIGR01457 family HAD-type hydrolase [Lysinibacillus capsici]MDP1394538.1 TIGR01457 family HAD-type hydrolase [Lysinibacillus capsici]MDP1414793.1 TIGR01457 family HAD-type hydrolase [Lysinibacillus capsici]MDP1430686.1 TIGR01457 family HAD-type hydrolase [Lysinibacillus capsici]MEC1304388.1 TIGR01457 family HAD-type hydrolase [Lysinibacillus capsici]
MKQYKAYCFDLDGTVYRGKEGIPSAVAFIHRLQQAGIEPFYVTNNSSKTREQLQEALLSIGVNAPLEHIYSSALVTAKYVALHFPSKKVAMMGTDGIRQALLNENIVPVEDEPDVFVMGIDRTLDYMALARATVFVQQGATFIATNQDIKFPTEYGFLPGNGSFARLVGEVADVEPIYIGKPSPAMLEVIATEHGIAKEDMVMIGDNYDTDIMCGIRFGCDTIHVNTGVTPTKIVLEKECQPTYVVDVLK